MKPLLCLSHQPSVTPGILGELFDEQGISYRLLKTWRTGLAPDVEEASGVVVLGGEMNVDEIGRHPFLATNRAVVSQALEMGKPVLGICLGAQMMARALGAPVDAAATREIGFQPIEATAEGRDDEVMGAFADVPYVFQWHRDAFVLPSDATLLFTGNGMPQAFRYGESAYGVQFHFEVTPEIIKAWCDETSPAQLEAEWGTSQEALLEETGENLKAQRDAAADTVRRFTKLLTPAA